ncbi:Metallo-beta-lactamase family protein [Aurantiacibacter gangjinensis]|uniref:Beta-lactamase n=2 Tax=Aurantiacibacter gangjinensis TaxID=502682 RepID=A0A0G9MPH6_9SPHN|nr:MBL fold metallo-hydrolase [Aurantiacibacter gangjinensis]APE29379.1 Metallo-beta-lactamase family protein [Aurantiacibacter gangjinensis]KLE31193.1 beta-lactamase [Aurantiacibacter gangjinensis]
MALPDQPWPTGDVERPEPLVARVLAPNASPFTYTGTQTYLVGSEDGLAVIDPGPDDKQHIAALLAAIGDAEIVAIMCTHTHRDHSPAAAPLAEATGAPIVGCGPLVINTDEPRLDAAFDRTYAPDRVLADGESVSAPGWTLTAIATPGHTSNHLCFALEESGAVFTGDHVMGWSTSIIVPPDGDMGHYLESLALLYERKQDKVYYPAHGPAVTKPHQLVRSTLGHRRAREKQIGKLLAGGVPAKAGTSRSKSQRSQPSLGLTIEDLVPVMYKGLDERMWPAAGLSVKAHLLDMERRGIVSRSGDIWQTI